MEFRILGPLEVRRDGAELAVVGRTLPRVLAALLLEAGRVVPLAALVDAVWDEEPPAAVRRRVQNLISMLRGVLDDPGRRLLQSVGDGYRLHIPEDRLDALRFDSAVRDARRLTRSGDLPAAAAGLRQALALWRGPALAGLTGRLIESGARRWDEARVAVTEERIEVDLALGRGPTVVGELRQLVASHPDRPRLAGHLMLALHQDGRDAEALATFERVRRRLADRLGLDPTRELADLQRSILRQDPALRTVQPALTIVPVAPRSAPLPAVTPHFTGRADHLARLDRVGTSGPSPVVVVLSGIGGSGKTALALHWGLRNADRFPEGALYIDLHGFDRTDPLPPREALARLLPALGLPTEDVPADLDQVRARYRSLLSGRRVLVVLDNARDADHVRPLLPGTPGSVTIVTSRRRLAGLAAREDAHLIPLGSLTSNESQQLLGSMVGEERLAAEPAAAARLADVCAGLPLALRIAATALLVRPASRVEDVATALCGPDRVQRLAVAGDESATLVTVFDLSYVAVEPPEELLYLRLALLPQDDISRDLALALCDEPPAEADRVLANLETAHRLEQYRSGRYRFHDLVREYARQKARSVLDEPARHGLRERVIDYYASRGHLRLPAEDHRNVIATCVAWADHPGVSRLRAVLPELAWIEHPGEPRGVDTARPGNGWAVASQ